MQANQSTAPKLGLDTAGGALKRYADWAMGIGVLGLLVTLITPISPVALDLNGIAKGYGVDRLAETLRDCGIGNALVGIDGEMHMCSSRLGVADPLVKIVIQMVYGVALDLRCYRSELVDIVAKRLAQSIPARLILESCGLSNRTLEILVLQKQISPGPDVMNAGWKQGRFAIDASGRGRGLHDVASG